MVELHSRLLMLLNVELDAPLIVGARRILHAKGGSFAGPRLEGEVLPGGGDWVLDRRDGVAELDIRFTLRTRDAQLIYASARGIFDAPPEVRQRIRGGESVPPAEYYFRTAWMFETGAEAYARLNRLIAVGVARRTPSGMVTDIFETA
jgi:hypothetical protein